MSFEDTGSRLLALLNSAEPPECAELLRLLDTWSEEFERGEQLDAEDGGVAKKRTFFFQRDFTCGPKPFFFLGCANGIFHPE